MAKLPVNVRRTLDRMGRVKDLDLGDRLRGAIGADATSRYDRAAYLYLKSKGKIVVERAPRGGRAGTKGRATARPTGGKGK